MLPLPDWTKTPGVIGRVAALLDMDKGMLLLFDDLGSQVSQRSLKPPLLTQPIRPQLKIQF
jgi:hypothetical protein